ncbi:MAG: hypothetical protein AAF266_13605 [Planctomycetota bacterium]
MVPTDTAAGVLPLLAQRSTWENLGNRFSGEHLHFQSSDLISAVGAIALVAGIFWLLGQLSKMQAEYETKPCPRRLLAELGRRHGLNRRELRLCREVSKELSLDHPAEVFVRDSARTLLTARDAKLAKRLFG